MDTFPIQATVFTISGTLTAVEHMSQINVMHYSFPSRHPDAYRTTSNSAYSLPYLDRRCQPPSLLYLPLTRILAHGISHPTLMSSIQQLHRGTHARILSSHILTSPTTSLVTLQLQVSQTAAVYKVLSRVPKESESGGRNRGNQTRYLKQRTGEDASAFGRPIMPRRVQS